MRNEARDYASRGEFAALNPTCRFGLAKVAHGDAHDLAHSMLMDYCLHFDKTLFEAHELALPLCGEFLPDVIERAPENWGIHNDKFDIWLAYKPETRMAMAE